MGGPCGWLVETCGGDLGEGEFDTWQEFPVDVRNRAAAAATLFMWAATGRQYGLCPKTVRPSNQRQPPPLYQTFPLPGVIGDYSSLYGGCSHTSGCQVELPGPVYEIIEVRIDGFPVDFPFEVHDGRILVRMDGQCWPTCNVYGSSGIPGFEVDYRRGQAIPSAVQYATEKLACEYAKDLAGGDCKLPSGLRSLTRQGVSVDMEEVDVANLTRLRTNVKDIDDVLDAVNPHGLPAPREIVSPDDPKVTTVTWPSGFGSVFPS